MSGHGRPLRFLTVVAVCWTGARVAILWHETGSLPQAIREAVPIAAAVPARTHRPASSPAVAAAPAAPRVAANDSLSGAPRLLRASDPVAVQFALLSLVRYGDPEAVGPLAAPVASIAQATPSAIEAPPARWSGSAWIVARPGFGIGAAPGAGQLGGSQAGVRLVHPLARDARVALAARFATPLEGSGREAALGVEWQPAPDVPLRLVAEARIPADDVMRGGPAVGAIAGTRATLVPGVRVDGYAQAGAVFRRRTEPYADGAARVTGAIAEPRPRVRLALGAGMWGAAQRDAARLDIGPSAVLDLPAGSRTLRLSLDWRERVAGNARPGSGVALTLGADF